MISNIVHAVEQHFFDNWTFSEVNYEQSQFTPSGDEWVEIVVIPLLSENASLENCTTESFELHTLVYASNKVKAGALVDKAVTFLQNTEIGELRIKGWGIVANGYLDTDDKYFYKIYFDCQA